MRDERTPKDVCGEASEIDEEKKTMGDEREKGIEPSLSSQSPLIFPRVRFNYESLPHHLNSAVYYLNAWNKLKDKRKSALNLVVGT